MDELTIGELARRSGVATSALRFYEAEGLISSRRTTGNQRRYDRGTLRTVSVIKAARAIGLGLGEVSKALTTLPGEGSPSKDDWARMGRAWRDDLDRRIRDLERLRDDLTGCIGCGCLSLRVCALFNPGDVAGEKGSGPRYLEGDTPPA